MLKLIKILIVLALAGKSEIALSGCFLGFTRTHHIITEGLNDNHLNGGCESDQAGFQIFENSFGQIGTALYLKHTPVSHGKWSLTLRTGLVTGYERVMHYNGYNYRNKLLFVSESVSIMFAPEVEYQLNKNTSIIYTQLSEATGLGIRWTFQK